MKPTEDQVRRAIKDLEELKYTVDAENVAEHLKGLVVFSRCKTNILKKLVEPVLVRVRPPAAPASAMNTSLYRLYKNTSKTESDGEPRVENVAKRSRTSIGPTLSSYMSGDIAPSSDGSRKDFRLEELPDFNLSSLGGIGKVIQEVRNLIIRPLKHRELYDHLGVAPVSGVLLHGPPGSGKTRLALAIAGEARVPFFKVSAPELITGISGESESLLRSLFSTARAAAPSLIFIDELDAICPKRENAGREMERRIVAQLGTSMDDMVGSFVIVIAATNRAEALDPMIRRNGRFDREIAMGIPDEPARSQMLTVMSKGIKLDLDVDLGVIGKRTAGFVGADLEAVTKEAALLSIQRIFGTVLAEDDTAYSAASLELLSVKQEDFIKAISAVQPSAKREGFATAPDVSWDDVGGLAGQRKELEDQICNPIKDSGLYQKLGLDVPAGILLFGPPGCGKTLLAKAVASESGANFISVKGPELLNKYVGESEKAVRQVFQRARMSAPCIIFFDELDSLCCHRGLGGTAVSERVVNQLLTEMDGVQDRRNVYVIAATNRPDLIDPAMLRPGRLERLVSIPHPDKNKRVDILHRLGRKILLKDDVDFLEVGEQTEGFSGADLAALLRQAVMLVLEGYRQTKTNLSEKDLSTVDLRVSMPHIIKALETTAPSVTEEHLAHYAKIVDQPLFAVLLNKMEDFTSSGFKIGGKILHNLDLLTAENPHCEDPRVLLRDQLANCYLRYTIFCRCCRELGPDHVRCKYQYYRSQITCPLEQIENWDEEKKRGMCKLDILPDRSLLLRGIL